MDTGVREVNFANSKKFVKSTTFSHHVRHKYTWTFAWWEDINHVLTDNRIQVHLTSDLYSSPNTVTVIKNQGGWVG